MWVKRTDVHGARYSELEEVDLQQTVSKFIARWVAQAKLDVDPSLVTLRLVWCGSRKPTAKEEEAAVELDDPSLSLGESGVTRTAWLLAFVAGSPGASCLCSCEVDAHQRAAGALAQMLRVEASPGASASQCPLSSNLMPVLQERDWLTHPP